MALNVLVKVKKLYLNTALFNSRSTCRSTEEYSTVDCGERRHYSILSCNPKTFSTSVCPVRQKRTKQVLYCTAYCVFKYVAHVIESVEVSVLRDRLFTSFSDEESARFPCFSLSKCPYY